LDDDLPLPSSNNEGSSSLAGTFVELSSQQLSPDQSDGLYGFSVPPPPPLASASYRPPSPSPCFLSYPGSPVSTHSRVSVPPPPYSPPYPHNHHHSPPPPGPLSPEFYYPPGGLIYYPYCGYQPPLRHFHGGGGEHGRSAAGIWFPYIPPDRIGQQPLEYFVDCSPGATRIRSPSGRLYPVPPDPDGDAASSDNCDDDDRYDEDEDTDDAKSPKTPTSDEMDVERPDSIEPEVKKKSKRKKRVVTAEEDDEEDDDDMLDTGARIDDSDEEWSERKQRASAGGPRSAGAGSKAKKQQSAYSDVTHGSSRVRDGPKQMTVSGGGSDQQVEGEEHGLRRRPTSKPKRLQVPRACVNCQKVCLTLLLLYIFGLLTEFCLGVQEM
jgi:hypothetical protein